MISKANDETTDAAFQQHIDVKKVMKLKVTTASPAAADYWLF